MPKSGPQGTNERAQAVKPSVPHLPDEIILFIYQLLHDKLSKATYQHGCIVQNPSCIRLNKRLYKLLSPIWWSRFRTRPDVHFALAHLFHVRNSRVLPFVKVIRLDFDINSQSVQTAFAALSRLKKLHTLTVRLPLVAAHDPIDLFSLSLPPPTSVRELKVFASSHATTRMPPLSQLFPRLVSLTLPWHRFSGADLILADLPSTVKVLKLDMALVETLGLAVGQRGSIPVTNLERLELGQIVDGEDSGSALRAPKALATLLHIALWSEKNLPLTSLHLKFEIQRESRKYFDMRDLLNLLSVLATTSLATASLQHLSLAFDTSAFDDSGRWIPWDPLPSVESLGVKGSVRLRDEVRLPSFPHFLRRQI
ncbi:hypothetical protein JCM11491_007115 [Sporobolomyces phaffii]